MKIDLSKAYDKVIYLYIRMILTHLGFGIGFIMWIMSCITTVSFSMLINGVTSPFFHVERGFFQGFHLSPLLFLLVAKGLSNALKEVKRQGTLKGIQISPNLFITHLLFVDDVLIFCYGLVRDSHTLREILDLFSKLTGMEVNAGESTLTTDILRVEERLELIQIFPFNPSRLDVGLKHLGFHLKPNKYKKKVFEKFGKKVKSVEPQIAFKS